MRGPLLTSILWIYGSDITNADPGDEHCAVTIPPPVEQRARMTQYIMRKIDGAIPVEYVWDKLGVGAQTTFPYVSPVIMTNEIESKFNAMVRHGFAQAKNCKVEWEIRK